MFILKQGNTIAGVSKNKSELETLKTTIPSSTIEETNIDYILYNGSYLTPEEVALKEQDKINHLTCTALDLATFIKQAGLTDAEVLQFLNSNPSLQLQLTLCKDVYCGVVRQLCPLKIAETLTLTDEMVVAFFKKKHNIE